MKLIIIAHDMDSKNTFIDANILEPTKRLDCEVLLVRINSDWIRNEELASISKIPPLR